MDFKFVEYANQTNSTEFIENRKVMTNYHLQFVFIVEICFCRLIDSTVCDGTGWGGGQQCRIEHRVIE